jgi:hypothetical protein
MMLSAVSSPPPARTRESLADKLDTLYRENPDCATELSMTLQRSLANCLLMLRKDQPSGYSCAELNEWTSRQLKASKFEESWNLVYLINCLPAARIEATLGKEVILWMALNSGARERSPHILTHLSDNGVQVDHLMDARSGLYKFKFVGNSPLVLEQYKIFHALKNGGLDKIDLVGALCKFWNGSQGLPTADKTKEYALVPIVLDRNEGFHDHWHSAWYHKEFSSKDNQAKRYYIWLDAPTGVLLLHRGQPQCLATFIAGENRRLEVPQIQGLKAVVYNPRSGEDLIDEGKRIRVGSRGLQPIYFRELLEDCLANFARQLNFESMVIIGAANNPWTYPKYEEKHPHLAPEKARVLYDDFALRLGYTKETQSGNWIRAL